MNDHFEIPVTYKQQEYLFAAELITMGYTYKIVAAVFGNIISFEPDEERNFRAIINIADLDSTDKIDKQLLQEIVHTLNELFRN